VLLVYEFAQSVLHHLREDGLQSSHRPIFGVFEFDFDGTTAFWVSTVRGPSRSTWASPMVQPRSGFPLRAVARIRGRVSDHRISVAPAHRPAFTISAVLPHRRRAAAQTTPVRGARSVVMPLRARTGAAVHVILAE